MWDRHRESLLHQELLQAYTSAAIYNLLGSSEEPVSEAAFMPNFSRADKPEEEKPLILPVGEVDEYRAKRAHIAALLEIRRNTGRVDPALVEMGLVNG